MNTQGWIRGIMAKNMEEGKFLRHVAGCFSREFDMPVKVLEEEKNYIIRLDKYEITVEKDAVREKQNSGVYTLDRMLLDKLKENGLEFSRERSQYIRYCYGIFYKAPDGSLY